ncbi:hypothetical protein [Caballeronia arvi]|uniref:hypothetical protein n=1 Tax=Caballeronia arvi TaxID=1777135 RepID=UPI000772CABD|nr:hypothetical protein [Caballeronia arvi]
MSQDLGQRNDHCQFEAGRTNGSQRYCVALGVSRAAAARRFSVIASSSCTTARAIAAVGAAAGQRSKPLKASFSKF